MSSSQKIDEFEQALASFKQQIESGVVLQTAIVSTRTPQKIDDLHVYKLCIVYVLHSILCQYYASG